MPTKRNVVMSYKKAGVERDAGFFAVDAKGIDAFVAACGKLRFWEREAKVHA